MRSSLATSWRNLLVGLPRPVRRVLAPRAIVFWGLTALAAIVTASVVTDAVARADATARARAPRPVLVTTAAVDAGGVLTEANTAVVMRPADERPEGALADLPAGAVASAVLVRGEVVVASRLAPAGLSPAAALLPPGTRGVAVPVGDAPLPVVPGDRVDVVATLPLDLTGDTGAASVVIEGAVVVLAGDGTVVVGVPAADVATLASALGEGTVQLALRGVGA